jgi:O-antigen/teichoic acid export membrane protein
MAPLLLLSQFVQASNGVIKPAVSDLDARDQAKGVRMLSMLTQKYTLLLLLPAVFFLSLLGGRFLGIWMGAEFKDLGLLLALLSVAHLIRLSQYSSFLVLVGKGEHRIFGVLAISVAIATMVLAVVAVRFLGLGLPGVVLANVIPMVLAYGAVLPLYFGRKMGIPVSASLREVLLPALRGSCPAFVVTLLWRIYLPLDSWTHLLVMIACVVTIWSVSCWILALTQEERARFLRIAGRERA